MRKSRKVHMELQFWRGFSSLKETLWGMGEVQ